MQYVVKDLMITVLPLRGLGGLELYSCTGCTDCSSCTANTRVWDILEQATINPAVLSTMKQQLKELLAAVEAKEKVVHEAMRPSSAAEVEILQSYLAGAIEELKQITPPATDS
ncbi:hypothetical protein AA309_28680 [Microvirga vignae]|uniref:Uncharacterized protein n=1 Tax=Microvirga vignae TaxID=1225564 RepID=A0A0H1R4F4_9HYPH|nr:hypothetical protein [Microvirga vignae]KLK89919.1 hypothetical protein AA309_28680 [Microvirga vignae]